MKIELPVKYYLTHFRELRSVLTEHYSDFFENRHAGFLQDFELLSEDAQCLYLRMLNRKGKFFFKEGLEYQEISSLDDALEELHQKEFIISLSSAHRSELLNFLPKKKLHELLVEKGIPFLKSSGRDVLIEELNNIEIFPSAALSGIVVQGKMEEIDYLLFLFFGRLQKNLSLYTLRDLGVRKVSSRKAQRARFISKEEALSQYFYEKLFESDVMQMDVSEWPPVLNHESFELREETLLYWADELKKDNRPDKALELLCYCEGHPGREKRVRLRYQMGQKDEALVELEKILDAPVSDLEFLFAEDFLARKYHKQKRSILTETLRSARKIPIDESFYRSPEAGVQDYFRNLGMESFHVENYLWNSLFGLFFWEELFESEKSGLYNEFERTPAELFGKKFYELHEKEILKKLELLNSPEVATAYLRLKVLEKSGTPNGVFSWHESILPTLELFLKHADAKAVYQMLLHLSQDFLSRSTGFPDLMVIEENKVKFCEIKAEGDSLKQQQLLQMISLQRAGFEVEVLQVSYTFNPDQLYVVVDLETTGGMPPYHRITEIGAVKVRGGRIVERFQTLVNPERRISKNIEDLTGISNEMVRNAPRFSEVAEAFAEFSRDAIFVAHNVNFDYGFLQSEYERLEERFVRPYICTKSWMRKHYPGLPSYGLKNLTTHFNIPLLTHHRAMCDAEAAASLLFLINQKRAETATEDA